jgi:hypothetical protein
MISAEDRWRCCGVILQDPLKCIFQVTGFPIALRVALPNWIGLLLGVIKG